MIKLDSPIARHSLITKQPADMKHLHPTPETSSDNQVFVSPPSSPVNKMAIITEDHEKTKSSVMSSPITVTCNKFNQSCNQQTVILSSLMSANLRLQEHKALNDRFERSSHPNPDREVLVHSSDLYKNLKNSMKGPPPKNSSQHRQRQPPLLLQPVKSASPSRTSSTSNHVSRKESRGPRETVSPIVPVPHAFWLSPTQHHSRMLHLRMLNHPSESEFDTTRLGAYLSSHFNRLIASKSAPKSGRSYRRSHSVDASRSRNHGRFTSASGDKIKIANNESSIFNNSPCLSTFASPGSRSLLTSNKISSTSPMRISRSESLNSDESGSLSGDNDADTLALRNYSLTSSLNSNNSDPPKSVLKKSVSTSLGTGLSGVSIGSPTFQATNNPQSNTVSSGKKNVTFSAFATIQVMDQ